MTSMWGIDIVDLTDPRTKERDARSLRFITHEKDQVVTHPQHYWLLWAAKEATYKCRREDRNFSPTSIPIQITAKPDGALHFESEEMEGRLEVKDSHVLAVCARNLADVDFQHFVSDRPVDSANIRKKILAFFHEKDKAIGIAADPLGLPILLPSKAPISLSHHNHLGAFAYPKSV